MLGPAANSSHQSVALTGQVDLVRYLVAGNRTDYYRSIMRLFLDQYDQGIYQLAPEAIHTHIHRWDASYTLEQLAQDLDYLESYQNLMSDFATMGLSTIAAFKNRRRSYQATNLGLEVERFMRTLTERTRSTGALNVSTLQSLWEHLTGLEVLLTEADSRRVEQGWHELVQTFRQFHTDANDYFADMETARRQRMLTHESFLIYRDALERYLTEFAEALYQFGPWFRDRLRRWVAEGRVDKLKEHLLSAAALGNPLEQVDAEQVAAQFEAGWRGLFQWFTDGGHAERMQAQAIKAIELIANQARRLSERATSTAARHRELAELAVRFAGCHSLEQANRLAALVFGHESGRQWAGDGALLPLFSEQEPWKAEPLMIELAPVTRGSFDRRPRQSSPILDRGSASLIRAFEREQEVQRYADRLDALFGTDGILDLGDGLTVPDRTGGELLLNLLSRCLVRTGADRETVALDGSTIRLLNPHALQEGAKLCRIQLGNGELICPAFRLIRTGAEGRRGA